MINLGFAHFPSKKGSTPAKANLLHRAACAAVSLSLSIAIASAADDTGDSSQGGETSPAEAPALRPIQDTPGLPRVLLIGDSISIGYTLPVRSALAGQANVHRPPTNGGDTNKGLKNIDQWLGDGKWDVIHFNWGLHDLKYLQSGRQNISPTDYEKNLRALVARLKKTGAVLIWATTTPVAVDDHSPFRRVSTDVPIYNEVAAKVMKDNGILTDDLYALVLPQEEKIQLPQNVHYTPAGSKILAGQVADDIRKALPAPSAAPSK